MTDLRTTCRVPVDKLQFHLDEALLEAAPYETIEPCCGIIGQDRALRAMEMGLDIAAKGYNIFITGLPGTGRTTAVKSLLEAARVKAPPALCDICFVNNFKMAENPVVLYFPAGDGHKFKKAVGYLIDSLITVIPKIFAGESYKEKRQRIIREFETRQKDLFRDFEKRLKDKGFLPVQVQIGPMVRPDLQPIVEGQPVSFMELEKAVEEGKFKAEELERLRNEYETLFKELQASSEHSKKITGDLENELDRLDAANVVPLINDKIETLKRIYKDEKAQAYLEDLNEVLISLLDFFRSGNGDNPERFEPAKLREIFSQFTVNLLVDNAEEKGRPVIIEDHPTYKNLFGSIERVHDPDSGWRTDFTRIRSGSIIRANGGYLVLQSNDLFQDPNVWPTLKRTLRTRRLSITSIDVMNLPGSGLKPEAIDLDVKVILIGEGRIYDILYRADEEFKKIFKVKAEFDSVMAGDRQGVAQYTQFVKMVTDEAKLPPFDPSGLAAVAEHGVKLAGRKDRLSTRFTRIADLVTESAWVARKRGRATVDRDTVKQAVAMQRTRVNLMETKVQEMYERDLILIDVTGRQVGQINGLSVYDLGEYAFGRPARITASVSPGADGVINIEREADMAGNIYNKGVLILTGFMRHRFGRRRPLVFSASLCFEQSYSGIDGDSASSTEVYALLSALTGVPINQGLAVTGSINQKGEIQPIGGVNEKIEGFYDVCLIRGLTGEQGVLIPGQNVPDLMLRDDVVEAVAAGRFHIYAVNHIDEGMELLTGLPAGRPREDGSFPEGTVNYLAEARLVELADTWRHYLHAAT